MAARRRRARGGPVASLAHLLHGEDHSGDGIFVVVGNGYRPRHRGELVVVTRGEVGWIKGIVVYGPAHRIDGSGAPLMQR